MAIMDVKGGVVGVVTADVSAAGASISLHSNNSILLLHLHRHGTHPLGLPHKANTTPAGPPPPARDADKLQARPPRHDDDGAAVLGAGDGADGAVRRGLEEVDAAGQGEGGLDLDGESEGIWRGEDFFVGRVEGPFWGEALFASLRIWFLVLLVGWFMEI